MSLVSQSFAAQSPRRIWLCSRFGPDAVVGLFDHIGPQQRVLTPAARLTTIKSWVLRLGSPVRWLARCRACVPEWGLDCHNIRAACIVREREVTCFFAHVGSAREIPESQFDGFAVTYSNSHGYHALAALAKGAENLGLDRKNALTAAAHALADGMLFWRQGGTSRERLLQNAATPGGIAAAVMATLDKHEYTKIVEVGLPGGMARGRANARVFGVRAKTSYKR